MNRYAFALLIFTVSSLTFTLAALAASSHGNSGKVAVYQATTTELTQGKAVYEKNCAACHATGVAGAPKLGDKAAWKQHIAAELDHMTEHAIHGDGAMPLRGGNPRLSDAEVRVAVIHIMVHSR